MLEQTSYDEKTHEFTIKIKGIGGRVYYDIGADPTTASKEVLDQVLVTVEPSIRFICIDPTGERKQAMLSSSLKCPVKYGQRTTPNGK